MEDDKILEIERNLAFWNAGMALIQMAAGMMSGSVIMISNALCSAHHAFGVMGETRSRTEWIFGVILNILFAASCFFLTVANIRQLISGSYEDNLKPGLIIMIICAGSVVLKRLLSRNLLYLFLEYKSSSLLADAWHQKIDGTLFLISLIGLCGAKLGFLWMEPVVGIGVCFYFIRRLFVL